MRTRRTIFVCLTLAASYVAFAGCGGDDDATPPASDAGNESSLADTTAPPPPRPDARSPDNTGSACTAASDCYGDLDGAALKGEAVCIDKVSGGYCTHKCETDADCCAVPGECKTGLKQVCASFENAEDKYCFLSCEEEDIASANDAGASDAGGGPDGGFDGEEYCHKNTSPEFGCRSTGGGVENRQVCFPIGPAGDGGAGDGGGGGKKDSGLDASLDGALDADAN